MTELTPRLEKVKEADGKGLLIKEAARQLGTSTNSIREARSKLLAMHEISPRKSLLRGQALSDRIAELRGDPTKSNAEIANFLKVSKQTVKNHVSQNKNLQRRRPGRRYFK